MIWVVFLAFVSLIGLLTAGGILWEVNQCLDEALDKEE